MADAPLSNEQYCNCGEEPNASGIDSSAPVEARSRSDCGSAFSEGLNNGSEARPAEPTAHIHEGYYYCKHCGLDLTPDIAPMTGTYGDGPNCARSCP